MIVGAVGATLVVVVFEEFFWVLFGLVMLAVTALILELRLIGRRRHVGA
jgi:hypothetical protein